MSSYSMRYFSMKQLRRVLYISLTFVAVLCLHEVVNRVRHNHLQAGGKCIRYSSPKRHPVSSMDPEKSVIIYTRFRSGSSFLGSIFRSNPEVYYTFEPMKFIEQSPRSADLMSTEKVADHLSDVFSCSFHSLVNSSDQYWKDIWTKRAFCLEMKQNISTEYCECQRYT